MDDVLAAYYFSDEGVESRRKAADWAVGGWQQLADWGRCLDWIADQWGAISMEGASPSQDLQYSSRTGLVVVLL